MSEGRFDLSTFRSERMNEASTLTITPKRSSSRDVEIVEALSAYPPTNKIISTDDEDNSVVIPLAIRSKRYNPPAIHVMAFILEFPG
ncbi:hypothetical protein TNCV_2179711 [Trichonephila clavipes]|uniref:Uncharacterized protein n=1 Tax=Trichonephila clavipes TaxID=2585209 RepID=A0A8X7B7T9_TRICX|nr:hypothetical protein TNCV_2179711 [Trichonephila clavipes]